LNLFLLIYLGVYLTVALMASTLARSQSLAAAGAFGGLIVLIILGSIPRLSDYMPGQLVNWGNSLVLKGDLTAWPALVVAAVIIVLALIIACLRFEQEEI
jgi:ABC-type transport system involved in multi-copper enzyme maturation permease subunit